MKTKILSLGIDVSKDKLDACYLLKEGTKNLQVANNRKGMLSLAEKVSFQEKEAIPVVIEATGGYHYSITFFLQEKGFKQVKVINPMITKKHSNSSIRKIKTDKVDAELLARIGLSEKLHTYEEKKEAIRLKKYIRLIHFLQKKLQTIKTRLSGTTKQLLSDDLEKELLEELKENLESKIKRAKKEVVRLSEVKPDKISGVSTVHHIAIAGELGNIRRFSNRRQIVAFAGLDPSIKESGSSVRGKSRLSKRGSKTLRFFLFQSAWGVKMHNEKYQKYFLKKKTEGKHYQTCMSAVARKLLIEIYSNLKNHPYYAK
jgi:transposase